MADLITATNLPEPDLAYTAIIGAHRGLSDADSQELNARLVLILANHIGDADVLAQALELARRGLGSDPSPGRPR
jgi:hypothetical protein